MRGDVNRDNWDNYKNVRQRFEWLWKRYHHNTELREKIVEGYLSGLTKEQLIETYLPFEGEKCNIPYQ